MRRAAAAWFGPQTTKVSWMRASGGSRFTVAASIGSSPSRGRNCLGRFLRRERPEPGAAAAGHHHGVELHAVLQTVRSSWRMRAVAPHTTFPPTSKVWTSCTMPNASRVLDPVTPRREEIGDGELDQPGHLVGLRDVRVRIWHDAHPRRQAEPGQSPPASRRAFPAPRRRPGASPISSWASRSAAAWASASPGSIRPPGKEICPGCSRRSSRRRVMRTCGARRPRTKTGTSTAASASAPGESR